MNKIKEQIANNAKELIEGFVPSLYEKIDQMNEQLKSSLLLLKVAQEHKYDTKTKTDYMEELMNAYYNLGLAKCGVDSVSNELRNLYEFIDKAYGNYAFASDKEMAMATEWFKENYQEAKDGDRFYHFVNDDFGCILDDDEFGKGVFDMKTIREFKNKAKASFKAKYDSYCDTYKYYRIKRLTQKDWKNEEDWKSYVMVYEVKNGGIVPTDGILIF